MLARKRKTESLRLRPVQAGIIADRTPHRLAGICIVIIEKQRFDPGTREGFITALIRRNFQERQRIADITHGEQTVDPQCNETGIQRFAGRHARLGHEQLPGHPAQRGRRQARRHPRHQCTDNGPLCTLPEIQREGALVNTNQSDRIRVDGLQPVNRDPGSVKRTRRHGDPGQGAERRGQILLAASRSCAVPP